MTNCNDNGIWVIKDLNGSFAHENSIRMVDKDTLIYISYHTFSSECRGYTTEERALEALDRLNKARDKYEFDVKFHLEQANRIELAKQYREFTGENMIIVEKNITRTSLTMKTKMNHKHINNLATAILPTISCILFTVVNF